MATRRHSPRSPRVLDPTVFHPLMKPMVGVTFMELLRRRDKQVLIIGERHDGKECRDLGYEDVDAAMSRFIKNTPAPNFDLMVEMDPFGSFRNPFYKNENATLHNLIVEAQGMNQDNFRLHYLDANNDVRWMQELKVFADKALQAHFNVPMKWFDNYPALKSQIERAWDGSSDVRPAVMKLLNEAMQETRFSGCAQRLSLKHKKPALYSYTNNYRLDKLIWESIVGDIQKTDTQGRVVEPRFVLAQALFYLQRRFVDLNAYCRVMKERRKTGGAWYKNIIIYAGSSHSEFIAELLRHAKFDTVPIKIDFNPYCDYTPARIVKRLKESLAESIRFEDSRNALLEFNDNTLRTIHAAVKSFHVGSPKIEAYTALFERNLPNSYYGSIFRSSFGLDNEAFVACRTEKELAPVRADALHNVERFLNEVNNKRPTDGMKRVLAFLQQTPDAPLDPIEEDIHDCRKNEIRLLERLKEFNAWTEPELY